MIGLNSKWSDVDHIASGIGMQVCLFQHPLTPEPHFDQASRQSRGVHRRVELFQEMGQAADVIQMPMGDENGAYKLLFVAQIVPIRDNIVDAQHIRFREHHPGIDNDDIAAIFDNRHVLAHFPQAAQGHDL